ncbi:protein LSM14 homolog car-1 isoform X2 [Diachasmimorpha longicaudata]|uniref:protein LSM14 homolog car-1 isoform X2 n=1 Tax=Diachasmimorpha longicaudata TaxID=58733 RepID=UPI0030B8B99C
MSAGMPELGSKISLISKADIRYEGRLFTVDPQECTIALANVRSFGTEDRETQFAVAPQNQVYEYILFRGSDIKDIRVVNNVNTLPNDPAIVQMTVQPSMGQQSYQPQPGYGHPMMPQMGPMGGQYGAPYGMAMGAMGPVMGLPSASRDPRMSMSKPNSELNSGPAEQNIINIPNSLPTANVKPLTKDQSLEDGVLEMLSGASRSTTPTSSLLTRKSPTNDQGTQVGHQQNQQGSVGKVGDKPINRGVQGAHRDRDTRSRGRSSSGMSQYSDSKADQLRESMHPDGQMQHQGQRNVHIGQGGPRGNRGGWIPRGNIQRGRGRGGRGGVFRSNQPGNAGAKPKNTLKFENDYDFEQANTEFEELRSRLAKTKIDAGAENEKKDDSGNETGAGENEQEEDSDVVHYDKSKSFFDNISCEAVERSKGSQRTDWRTERKLNSETFGVSSTRRGGFRGRGYYHNRGMSGGMYRGNNHGNGGQMGGYRGNYRGQRGGNNANRKTGQNQSNNAGQNRNNNEQNANQPQQTNRLIPGVV